MQSPDALETLVGNHPFFPGLDPESRYYFQSCASLRGFAAHQQIFNQGGEADHFYLIISGSVALEAAVPGGGRAIVQNLGAGDALGWSWLFPPQRWQFTATTRALTEVLSFSAAMLRLQAQVNRDFGKELYARVSGIILQRLQATRTQLIELWAMQRHAPAVSASGCGAN